MVWVALPEPIRVCLYHSASSSWNKIPAVGAAACDAPSWALLQLLSPTDVFQSMALSLWYIGEAPWKPSWSWNQTLEPCFYAVYESFELRLGLIFWYNSDHGKM